MNRRAFPGVAAALLAGGMALAACGGRQAASADSALGAASAPATVASAKAAAVALPSGFRDFDLVAYQGEDVLGGREAKFSRLFGQGKPVILNFWAGLCPPCRAEMPSFQRVANANSGKVIFFGLDVGPFVQLGSHEDAVQLYNALGIRYPLGYATSVQPLRLYSVQGMPTTVFLSAAGRVVDKVSGIVTDSQLQSEIQKLLTAE